MSKSEIYDIAVVTDVGLIEVLKINTFHLRFIVDNKRLPQVMIDGLNIQDYLIAPHLKERIRSFVEANKIERDPELIYADIARHISQIKIKSKPMFPVKKNGIEL